jgi:diphosphomevalonate decarboxylase
MNYENPRLVLTGRQVAPGALRWRSPSNIALVKYWGKHGDQLPRNPSVSFTLEGAATDTTLHYTERRQAGEGVSVQLFLAGERRADFTERTRAYLHRLLPVYPFLAELDLRVETSNSFPHSAGIASSASGMSALALCLVQLEERLFDPLPDRASFLRKASELARLGSGSAGRSVYGRAAVWGETAAVAGSSDDYAIPVGDQLHPVFRDYHDDILLVSRAEKTVSSRAGHGLMDGNPYAPARYQQAKYNLRQMVQALREGEVEKFGQLLESEALTLHALMMSSQPSYTLIEPGTLSIIQRVRAYRRQTGRPVYFTLDAGPNIHLLYPQTIATAVSEFVREELFQFCGGEYLADRVGNGPEELSPRPTSVLS